MATHIRTHTRSTRAPSLVRQVVVRASRRVLSSQIFDKLAHSSIMRLNEASMTKLYSLMVMGFKHQILAAPEPRLLLDITERHLKSLKPVCPCDAI